MKNRQKTLLGTGMALMLLGACAPNQPQAALTVSGLDPANYETTIGGEPVKLYTLKNEAGMEVCITNYGGRIVSVAVPDKNGEMKDVVLGFDSIGAYQHIRSDCGASIGRYANRIGHGRFVLGGDTIQLPVNNYGHCLHGGPTGWQYQVYGANPIDGQTVELNLTSPDGDNNFPGTVNATVVYRLTDDNAIDIRYSATTDKKTIINMTNHSYFNLSGDPSRSATDHVLYVDADYITPVDSTFMTTGEMMPVAGTPFDFTTPKPLSEGVNDFDNEQVKFANGYDHNWVLNTQGDISRAAVRLTSPESGITLEVYTTEPGIQVYTGNFLDGTISGKKGILYGNRPSVCLETQHYPDSPNKPQWPSVVLEPGETYRSECIFKFSGANE